MEAIRTTKIDGQEFVTLTDYLRLKEENKVVGILNDEIRRINKNLREENKKLKEEKQELEYLGDINEGLKEENQKLLEKNRNLKLDLEKFSEAYRRYRDYEKEELAESCYDLERENQKLKERIAELENLPFKKENE